MSSARCWIQPCNKQSVTEPSLRRCPHHLLLLTGPHPGISSSPPLHAWQFPGWPTESIIATALAPLCSVGLLPGWECMAEADHKGEEWLQWENIVLSSVTCTLVILMAVTSKFNHYFWDFLFSSFCFPLLLCTSLAFMVSLFHSWDCSQFFSGDQQTLMWMSPNSIWLQLRSLLVLNKLFSTGSAVTSALSDIWNKNNELLSPSSE